MHRLNAIQRVCAIHVLTVSLMVGVGSARAEPRPAPSALAPVVIARFGEPVPGDAGTLQYPGFTVRLRQKAAFMRGDGQPPWLVWTYEVLKDGHLTIGGNLMFNADERVNARRFDVGDQIYVAEKHSSGMSALVATPLPDEQLIIWDQASAEAQNPILGQIWKTETIDANSRYSSQNAYTNGVFIPGYERINDGRNRLNPSTHAVERVSVFDDMTEISASTPCRFGKRANFEKGPLRFPTFTVALVEADERWRDDASPDRSYRFRIFRSAGGDGPSITFDTANLANGASFVVGDKTYFAEIFFTSAGAREAHEKQPLRPGEIMVWDEATARRENPRIATAFETTHDRRATTHFAVGVPLGIPFTGTYLFGEKATPYRKLDARLQIVQDGDFTYPQRYAGTGLVAEVGGFFFVAPDGTVNEATVAGGSDQNFQASTVKAVSTMRFSPPLYQGKPTTALVHFDWQIKEPIADTRAIRLD